MVRGRFVLSANLIVVGRAPWGLHDHASSSTPRYYATSLAGAIFFFHCLKLVQVVVLVLPDDILIRFLDELIEVRSLFRMIEMLIVRPKVLLLLLLRRFLRFLCMLMLMSRTAEKGLERL